MGRRKQHLTRQQHIVTAWYLANFCGLDGRLHVFGKDHMPRVESAAKACRERDFYEFDVRWRRTSNQYEDWLARLEGGAKSVFPKIVGRERLTWWEAAAWSAFVASTFIRTRKYRNQISEAVTAGFRQRSQSSDFVSELQYELFKSGILHSEAEVRRRIDELRTAMEDSESFYHVLGLPRHCRTLGEAVISDIPTTDQRGYRKAANPASVRIPPPAPGLIPEMRLHLYGLGPIFGHLNPEDRPPTDLTVQ